MSVSFQDLLATQEPAALGPDRRGGCLSVAEINKSLDAIYREKRLSNEKQELIRALILLWHDHPDEAHSISQDITSADGSYVHGLVHRREPDYGNAKYWFHRVGKHPAFASISEKTGKNWDPMAFIDSCQKARGVETAALQKLQQIEFSVLLDLFSHE